LDPNGVEARHKLLQYSVILFFFFELLFLPASVVVLGRKGRAFFIFTFVALGSSVILASFPLHQSFHHFLSLHSRTLIFAYRLRSETTATWKLYSPLQANYRAYCTHGQ
jgi:hypothetical protein